ncbi:MAG TPA: hypothetical protein VL346_01700 [Acidobacteriaceae bacterium]|nr:hypothetical protein [Acidobacteriaceae bacterium]
MQRHPRELLNFGMLTAAMLCSMSLAAGAQQQAPADSSYQGVAHPPSDVIEATPDVPVTAAKPSPAVRAVAQPAPQQAPVVNYQATVQPEPQPEALTPRYSGYNAAADPDGDIVHPVASRPGELMPGMTIRVRLKERLSSSQSEKGEPFHGVVASDVLQNGRVMIPAGSAIEGRVTYASSGQHLGGHGSIRLKPEAVILPDGSRVELHAETTGTPGSHTRIGGEGTINPGSRAKRDGMEYGAVVGTGAVAGAVVGGPVGALTGSLIGAGIVSTHLMVDHPQAVLEPGSVILFTLTEPMNQMPAATPGN